MKARGPSRDCRTRQCGLSLVELMIAGLVASMLLTGLVQVAAGTRSSFALQEAVAELQESARFALESVGGHLRQSGFLPQPWSPPPTTVGPVQGSADGVTARSDRLVLRTWSDRNCFGTINTELDAAGHPEFFVRESVFELNAAGNLALTCRYGRDESQLVNQVPGQGVLPRVEAFQALFAEDIDGDGRADRWVPGGAWSDPGAVLGVQVALLLASRDNPGERVPKTYNVLDHVVRAPPDGRLRRTVSVAHAFRGRVR